MRQRQIPTHGTCLWFSWSRWSRILLKLQINVPNKPLLLIFKIAVEPTLVDKNISYSIYLRILVKTTMIWGLFPWSKHYNGTLYQNHQSTQNQEIEPFYGKIMLTKQRLLENTLQVNMIVIRIVKITTTIYVTFK